MKFKSCETRWYGIHFYIMLVFTIIVIVIPGLIVLFTDLSIEILPDDYILLSILLIPFLIYYCYRYIYFSRLKPTHQQILKLEKIETKIFYRARYSVMLKINGNEHRVYTLPVFSTRFIGVNKINYFTAKKVLIGYDEKKDIAVVLKVVE